MATLSKSVKMKVVDMLEDDWDPSNTLNIDPRKSSGWYDFSSDYPQVTVSGVSENATNGGDTGYMSINLEGGPPTQMMQGEVNVHCWAQRNRGIDDNNPKTVSYKFSTEVKRIIRNNFDSDSELEVISFQNRTQQVDTETSPVTFRFICTIGYLYIERA